MYDLLLVALAFLSIGAAQFLKKSGDKTKPRALSREALRERGRGRPEGS